MTDTNRIEGLRLLVVEDEALVAMMIEDILDELGCRVVGLASSVGKALELARTGEFDGAILDVNLGGDPIYPVADALAERGIPFVFVTGYGASGVDERYADSPTLQKPFQPTALEHAVAEGVARRRGPTA